MVEDGNGRLRAGVEPGRGIVARIVAILAASGMIALLLSATGAVAQVGRMMSPPMSPPAVPDGTLEVEKQTLPDGSPQEFVFGDAISANLKDGESASVDLAPGTYSFTETVPGGWVPASVACNGSFTATFAPPVVTVTVDVASGETTSCVVTNWELGDVVVEKAVNPAGAGGAEVFSFSGSIVASLGEGGFSPAEVFPMTHTIEESPPPLWFIEDITCDTPGAIEDLLAGDIEFDVAPGQTVTCTFTNAAPGRIVVEKVTDPPGSSQDFEFTGSLTATLTDGQSAGEDVMAGTMDSMGVVTAPGTYTVSEVVPADWSVDSIECDDSDSGGDPATATAMFLVSPGETVTCTFTDRADDGTITVVKETDPAGFDQEFAFSGALSGAVEDGESLTASVRPGTHEVTEAVPADWSLSSIVCDDDDSSGSGATATFAVAPGEDVTCTFRNEAQFGTIVITKDARPDSRQPVTFREAGSAFPDVTLDDYDGTARPDSETIENLPAGTYMIEEVVPPMWRLVEVSCDDPSGGSGSLGVGAVVDLAPGETVTCTFVNQPRHQVGLHDPATGRWTLRDADGSAIAFTFGNPGDIGFVGDWDCDGVETPGVWRPGDQTVYLRNSHSSGPADESFPLGDPGHRPIAGDFDGDGCDTVSLHDPVLARFTIYNGLGGDPAAVFTFGDPGDSGLSGDFDGDGVETVGVYRPGNEMFYLRNKHRSGVADQTFLYGNPGDLPVMGDWNADLRSTPGVFREDDPALGDGTIYLRDANTTGIGDEEFPFGSTGWKPVAGRFRPVVI